MQQQQIPPNPQLSVLKPFLDLLPPMIARKEVKHFTGGAIASQTLANADNTGKGPDVRIKIGENVVYPTAFLLAYMEKQGVKVIVPPKL